jgi:hypothetical protein
VTLPYSYSTEPSPVHENITPSDETVYDPPFRALVVGTAGTLIVTDSLGNDATYTCVAGQTVVIVGNKVKAASTAGGIVAQY